ncbi:hypothetical protein SAMN05216233_10430 [Desulfoluna spongiiphila]|uniref:Uncharacterized protein n=1 Tax=Desulfoluna spongiiphila TaxID=419481 RepID=A0A1G5D780_9BACT|nr:hypothetical protein SAMN05216233_10430 [Desulfoluna spongiiphila]
MYAQTYLRMVSIPYAMLLDMSAYSVLARY